MSSKATEKVIEALSNLLEGFAELRESVEKEYADEETEEDDDEEKGSELDLALITEMKAAIEAVIDTDDHSPEEFATLISVFTDALEEVDPHVFEGAPSDEEAKVETEEDDEVEYDEDEELFEEEDSDDDDDDDDS